MGFILIGIIVGLVFFWIMWRYCENNENFGTILITLSILAVIAGIFAGIFVSTGYKPKQETETIKLINLSDEVSVNGAKGLFYITVNPENSYTYYTQIESEFADENSKAYVSNTISGENNVTIIEEEKCLNPRLVTYVEKSKITFWSFGIGEKRIYYVFYVPQNTVIHNYELG